MNDYPFDVSQVNNSGSESNMRKGIAWGDVLLVLCGECANITIAGISTFNKFINATK